MLRFIALLVFATSTCAQEPAKLPLAEAVKEVLNLPRYQTAHWGLYVVDAKTGEVLLDHQSRKLFAPASCTKLFSVAAAFESLGPDHRFHTRVVHTGKLDEEAKALQGDLILIASGDLTLGGRTLPDGTIAFQNTDHTYANGSTSGLLTEPDPLTGLQELASQVAKKVKKITGDVIIDDRLFEKAESTGSGPGRITPMLINDNLIDFTIIPGEESGKPASVKHRPEGSAIFVDAQLETGNEASRPAITISAPSPGRYVVRGSIPARHKPLLRVKEVDDPASHARSLFIDALKRAGVAVKASSFAGNPAEKLARSEEVKQLTTVAEFVSPPFSENARLILKVSHNLHASTLPLLLAARNQQRNLSQGLHQEAEALKRLGVPMEGISFGGGAGGARADHASPYAAVMLLKQMASRPEGEVYRKALPIVGVDGTPASAVGKESAARGKFQAKTGTLSWTNGLTDNSVMTSKALAGYGVTARGRPVLFAFFVNNVLVGEDGTQQAGRDLGRLCEIVHAME